MTPREQEREKWNTPREDGESPFLATVLDDIWDEQITSRATEFRSVDVDWESDDDDARMDELAERVAGVCEAFIVYLAKQYDTEWILKQLQK